MGTICSFVINSCSLVCIPTKFGIFVIIIYAAELVFSASVFLSRCMFEVVYDFTVLNLNRIYYICLLIELEI